MRDREARSEARSRGKIKRQDQEVRLRGEIKMWDQEVRLKGEIKRWDRDVRSRGEIKRCEIGRRDREARSRDRELRRWLYISIPSELMLKCGINNLNDFPLKLSQMVAVVSGCTVQVPKRPRFYSKHMLIGLACIHLARVTSCLSDSEGHDRRWLRMSGITPDTKLRLRRVTARFLNCNKL